MRIALLTLAFSLLALPAFAGDEAVPDDLREADFITAVDVEAEVPFGELFIDDAVIAIFPRLEDRLSGMVIGRVRLKMRPGTRGGEARGKTVRPVEFRVERAFLAASLRSEWKIAPKGRALAARRWDTLKQSERDSFLELYAAAAPDSWTVESDDSTLRDPKAKEFFTAFWSKLPRAIFPQDSAGEVKRFDFRVDATGNGVSLVDRSDNVTLFPVPAATEPDASQTTQSGTSQ